MEDESGMRLGFVLTTLRDSSLKGTWLPPIQDDDIDLRCSGCQTHQTLAEAAFTQAGWGNSAYGCKWCDTTLITITTSADGTDLIAHVPFNVAAAERTR
jgi:hypothetical protein